MIKYNNNLICYIYEYEKTYSIKIFNKKYHDLNNKEICKKIINSLINKKIDKTNLFNNFEFFNNKIKYEKECKDLMFKHFDHKEFLETYFENLI